jgi:hypothetical protein
LTKYDGELERRQESRGTAEHAKFDCVILLVLRTQRFQTSGASVASELAKYDD